MSQDPTDTTQEPSQEPLSPAEDPFRPQEPQEAGDAGTEIPVRGTDEPPGTGESGESGDSGSENPTGSENQADPIEVELLKWKNLALRSQADLENYRKRMSREKGESVKYANSALLESLLPILDNFNFGLEAARKENPESQIFKGMEMVLKQMADFLTDHGVERIDTEGREFDPNVHEALSQAPSADVPEGVIMTEARAGYTLRDRLLRAAQVVVSKGPETASEEDEAESPQGDQ